MLNLSWYSIVTIHTGIRKVIEQDVSGAMQEISGDVTCTLLYP
jgi:hypothetical protein